MRIQQTTERRLKLLHDARERYDAQQKTREERLRNLERLGRGGDWRKVDSPERVRRRLTSLGRNDLIADLMSSEAINDPIGPPRRAPSLTVLERIIGTKDFVSSSFLRVGAQVARSVGRIVSRGPGVGFGTGFLVSERLLLTNNHVLRYPEDAQQAAVQFDYAEFGGVPLTPVLYHLEPHVFFLTDTALDFTLVAVSLRSQDGNEGIESRGWSPLIEESGKTIVGEPVNIIQHPQAGLQQVALRQNEILDTPGDFLHYKADTEPGSSGSPVFNNQWELSALHHSGVPRMDNGNYLLVDGSVWDGSQSSMQLIDWVANEGVRISRIVRHCKAVVADMGSDKRRLFEASFAPRPVLSGEESARGAATETPGSVLTIQAAGARWSIPIRLTLDAAPIAAAPPPAPLPRTPALLTRTATSQSAELEEALRVFESHENEPYFDEDADLQEFDAYFTSWPSSASGAEWYQYFHNLLRQTHRPQLTYTTARTKHLYPWVDLRETENGRRLFSIYSDASFTVEEVLRNDFEVARIRDEKLRETLATESVLGLEGLEATIDALESSFPFNCEHVVPQSWFGKLDPMKSDLHHLFTCEPGCNSFRGNIPYFDFGATEAVRERCGRRELTKFEPAAGKGPVARATLYFLLRYPGLVGDENRELQRERLQMLLDWHENDPPGDYEFHRNRAIFHAQGNRNPLIDMPDIAAVIDFELGFGGAS